MELEVGSMYDEPGATAEDDVDGDVSDAIEVSGDVDTSTVGAYEVVYTVSDESGNEATETRTVNVVEAPGQAPGDGEDGADGDDGADGPDRPDGEDRAHGDDGADG